MFTGIVAATGRVATMTAAGGDARIGIISDSLDMTDVALGDSIAVNGVCLTAVALSGNGFSADVSRETLSLTTLGALATGATVNLEKALRLADRLGGHLVSGHVDGVGEVLSRHHDARSVRFEIAAPDALARYIAPKGSVAVDGTSLTVNGVDGSVFAINIVPHTLAQTIIDAYRPGTRVNLEVDLLARYLERLLTADAGTPAGADIEALLERAGFKTPGD